eukprot:7069825-Pyramimonas_sp.AAC.1
MMKISYILMRRCRYSEAYNTSLQDDNHRPMRMQRVVSPPAIASSLRPPSCIRMCAVGMRSVRAAPSSRLLRDEIVTVVPRGSLRV